MHYEKNEGKKLEEGLDTKEIAKRIRKDIKAAIKAGDLPEGLKVSVRISRGQVDSINTSITAFAGPIYKSEDWSGGYTDAASEVFTKLEKIAGAYQWSERDVHTDYYNGNYYNFVDFYYKLESAKRKAGELFADAGAEEVAEVEEIEEPTEEEKIAGLIEELGEKGRALGLTNADMIHALTGGHPGPRPTIEELREKTAAPTQAGLGFNSLPITPEDNGAGRN